METVRIYFKDLSEVKQRELLDRKLVDENVDLAPLAILEFEQEEREEDLE